MALKNRFRCGPAASPHKILLPSAAAKNFRRVLVYARFGVLLWTLVTGKVSSANADTVAWDTMPDTWTAVDDLGRNIAENATAGNPRTNKTLGMFYYIWQGSHGINSDSQ